MAQMTDPTDLDAYRRAAQPPAEHPAHGYATTGELLAELDGAAQVIADAHGLAVDLVRRLLLEWELHRPRHP